MATVHEELHTANTIVVDHQAERVREAAQAMLDKVVQKLSALRGVERDREIDYFIQARISRVIRPSEQRLRPVADAGFHEHGRGALVERCESFAELVRMGELKQSYMPQRQFADGSPALRRLMTTYDPSSSFVYILILRVPLGDGSETKAKPVHRHGDVADARARLRVKLDKRKNGLDDKQRMETLFAGDVIARTESTAPVKGRT